MPPAAAITEHDQPWVIRTWPRPGLALSDLTMARYGHVMPAGSSQHHCGSPPEGGHHWELVALDADHPGFRDASYRRRREEIARIALHWDSRCEVPDAPYSEDEHLVWRQIAHALDPLHDRWACRILLRCRDRLALSRVRIPQLRELNRSISAATGFRMAPVAGLVSARDFLECLAADTFLSTQYIRHHTRPWYTPEPDVVHEVIGHAASLLDPLLAQVNRSFGLAARRAGPQRMLELERIYWYTLEFGVVRQDGALKACGAGLLSSVGELERFASCATLHPFDLAAMARRAYDPTGFQSHLFVAGSIEQILALGDGLSLG